MIIRRDCKYFNGEKPCKFHKETGIHCPDCSYYEPIKCNILIIKLESVGDVLRTTSILWGLKEKFKNSHITWVTNHQSLALFENNQFVDVVLDSASVETLTLIQLKNFNLVINLDTLLKSAQLATIAKGEIKLGFGYDEKGSIYPSNKEAYKWYEMSLFDDIKKANKQSYQEIMLDMCNLNPSRYDLILNLTEEEKTFTDVFAQRNNFSKEDLIIGINTGAGKRWRQKQWRKDGFLKLIELLQKKVNDCKLLLYGGPEEIEINQYLVRNNSELIDAGCNNSLREFASLIDLCDILVTSDTLALHIAAALKKDIVALFGPTSHTEIELYGRGKKVYADLDCLCCYNQDCEKIPNCMDLITPEMVLEVIISVISAKRKIGVKELL